MGLCTTKLRWLFWIAWNLGKIIRLERKNKRVTKTGHSGVSANVQLLKDSFSCQGLSSVVILYQVILFYNFIHLHFSICNQIPHYPKFRSRYQVAVLLTPLLVLALILREYSDFNIWKSQKYGKNNSNENETQHNNGVSNRVLVLLLSRLFIISWRSVLAFVYIHNSPVSNSHWPLIKSTENAFVQG